MDSKTKQQIVELEKELISIQADIKLTAQWEAIKELTNDPVDSYEESA